MNCLHSFSRIQMSFCNCHAKKSQVKYLGKLSVIMKSLTNFTADSLLLCEAPLSTHFFKKIDKSVCGGIMCGNGIFFLQFR